MDNSVPAWLKDAVFYEIYPQSFHDSNGDGIGDLEGIRQKLDYVQSLGCNVVWLNPCFASPFGDAGYDVSDYRKVAPRYGTNADLRRLVADLHRRKMRLCLDFVPGHTSVEHPWFKKSCSPKPNRHSNWYIWTDSVWIAAPGFNTVNAISDRDGQYVTNFFWFQPALNYGFAKPDPAQPWQLPTDHPDVLALKREMRGIMQFWLEMGVDGFRVDMASSLVKGDTDGSAMRAHWAEERAWLKNAFPEAVLIAEWSNPPAAIPAGFHIDFMIHFGTPAYTSLFRAEKERFAWPCPEPGHSFFDRQGKGDITAFLKHYLDAYRKTRDLGYISLPTGNHDITRLNLDRDVAELKAAMAFLLTMPGIPTIYYGDEIGMRHLPGLVSKEGGFCRTGARTPMQWDRGRNAGFSTAPRQRLYLPVDPDPGRPTVAAQEKDPGSLLNHVRALLRLRRERPALGNLGEFELVHGEKGSNALLYLRRLGGSAVLVAVNPSAEVATAFCRHPAVTGLGATLLGAPLTATRKKGGLQITLPPRGYSVCELRT
ncbi:MAG: alpha-amylase family glycosyl hydrolase [Lentisphaeria bacterium]|jgi:maltose alpha-D-glucosyltransferase/alpha-amylase